MFEKLVCAIGLVFLMMLPLKTKGEVSFRCAVNSDESKTPISNAYVHLISLDSSFSIYRQTDTLGRANFALPNSLNGQRLCLTIHRIGYQEKQDTVKIGNDYFKVYYLLSDSFFTKMMVVTAQVKPKTLDKTVHKMRVITKKEIQEQGAVNLRDVLVNENCIQINQDNVLGSQITFQGMSGENVKILIDGVPVIGRLDGNIDLSQINLDEIERIEIVQGPLSVSYGSDALAGTINLITRKGQKKPITADVSSYYESIGQYNLSVRSGVRKNNKSFGVSLSRNYFDGWSSTDKFHFLPKENRADTFRVQQWKPKEQLFGTIFTGWRNKKWEIEYRGTLYKEEMLNKGRPRSPYYESAFDDLYATHRLDNTIILNTNISKNKTWQNTIAYNRYERRKNTYFIDLTTLEREMTKNQSEHDTTIFNFFQVRGAINSVPDSSNFAYQVGYEVQLENTHGKRIANGKSGMENLAVFTSAEYTPHKNITLRPGLRYGYNSGYSHPLIPSFSVLYSFSNVGVRGSYARGFRAPSLKELYLDFVDINHNIQGNSNLYAEKSNNYQLSIDRKFIIRKSLMTIGISGFFNNVSNKISLAQAGGTEFSYFNIDEFKARGGQLTWQSRIKLIKLNMSAGLTSIGNRLEGVTVNELRYSSFMEFNGSYSQYIKFLKMKVALLYKYTGRRVGYFLNSGGEVVESKVNDFHQMNVSLSKRFCKRKLQLVVGVKNLFDVKDVGVTNNTSGAHQNSGSSVAMMWGRSAFVALNINLYANYRKK